MFKYSDIKTNPNMPSMDRTPIIILHKYGDEYKYKDYVYYSPK